MAERNSKNISKDRPSSQEARKNRVQKEWADRVGLSEPGDENESGSIEQHLDMIERGPGPRGDDVLFDKGRTFDDKRDPNFVKELEDDEMLQNFHVDMSESNREGDEMSGDDHSIGFQGGDSELEDQPTTDDGLPGEDTRRENDEAKRGKGQAA